MSKGRYVKTNFWRDTYIVELDTTQKLLFLYFLTNPATNLSGVYEIDLRLVSLDTGIQQKQIEKVLQKFMADDKIHYQKGWLIIKNFIKNQRFNDSMRRGAEKELLDLPQWLQTVLTDLDYYERNTLEAPKKAQSDTSVLPQPQQTPTIEAKEKLNININRIEAKSKLNEIAAQPDLLKNIELPTAGYIAAKKQAELIKQRAS